MAKAPARSMKRRAMLVLLVFVMVGFVGLVGRLFMLQIVSGKELEQKAVQQQLREVVVTPQRGTIYDRNLKALAASATVYSLIVTPSSVKDDAERQKLANDLSTITGVSAGDLLAKMSKRTSNEVLKRKIEIPEAELLRKYIKDNNLGCIGLVEDSKRYYPFNNFAAQVLGFTGTDNQGLSGLESEYDKILRGTPGRVVSARNARGQTMDLDYDDVIPAQDGHSLVTTLDEVVQHYLEKHLADALLQNKVANKVTGIVMDVQTGGILAMATLPDFNPNTPFTISSEDAAKLASLTGDDLTKQRNLLQQAMWRNKAISDPYEPGSTFKIVTAASALEEKVVSPTDQFYCSGSINVEGAGKPINCWKTSGHGSETFLDGIKNSCNPVFIQVGMRLGINDFYKYFQAFGLTQKTGVDLPGEAANTGLYHVPNKNFVLRDLCVSSFGQSFKITPIQLITAVSAVANGGKLVTPHLISRELDADGNIVKSYDTSVKRQVISKATATELCGMLEQVVATGTGKNAYVAGYRVAGKTGTSQKLDEDAGASKRIASFAAFAPADNPKVAVLILLDEPHGSSSFGGVIAGPVMGSIMGDILPYIGVEPQYTQAELAKADVRVPNLVGKKLTDINSPLNAAKLKSYVYGDGDTVLQQMPAEGQSIPPGGTVVIWTGPATMSKSITVPDLTGMTVNEANQKLASLRLNIKLSGLDPTADGMKAYEQSPAAQSVVEPGTVVTVKFRDDSISVG